MPANSVETISSDDEGVKESNSFIFKHRKASVELHPSSADCLREGQYLTDSIIRFFLIYLLNELEDKTLAASVHVFDSIFYQQLERTFQSTSKIDPAKIKNLSKCLDGTDIFEKDFLIFPICLEHHWFVVIVCYPWAVERVYECPSSTSQASENLSTNGNGTASNTTTKGSQNEEPKKDQIAGILVLDSLRLRNIKPTLKIRDFLDYVWRSRCGPIKRFSHHDLSEYFPTLPKQTNAVDCGIYLMKYMKSFLMNPNKFYKLSKKPGPAAILQLGKIVEDHSKDLTRESIRDLVQKHCATQTRL